MTKPYVLNRKSSLWWFCIDSAFTVGWWSVVCPSSSWLWLYQPSGQTTFYQKLYLYILEILDTGWSSPVKTCWHTQLSLSSVTLLLASLFVHIISEHVQPSAQVRMCSATLWLKLSSLLEWHCVCHQYWIYNEVMMLAALSAVPHSCVYFALVVFSHLFSSFHLPECFCNLITLISMNPELHFDCMFHSFLAAQRSWPSALNDIWYLCWRTEFVSNF